MSVHALLEFMFLCALGGTPTLLLNSMDSQLEEARHRIRKAEVEIVEVKQDLAAAKEAKNGEREKSLFDLLLSLNNQLSGLNNQLSGLQEEKNILLRSQAPSKPCLQLVHAGSHHVALHSVETRIGVYQSWKNFIPYISGHQEPVVSDGLLVHMSYVLH